MNQTLQGTKGAESYVDNILFFLNLWRTSQKIASSVSPPYSIQLSRINVWLLGYRLTAQRRMPTHSFLEKLRSFPRPETLQELQRYLGTLNYYGSYIPWMAELATPLYTLKKKGALWLWGVIVRKLLSEAG